MKPREVDPRSGHQRCQAPHVFHWIEYDMGGAIVVGRLQRDDDVAIAGQRQSSLCNSWSRDVAAQTLKLLSLMRLAGDSGMQRETCLLGHQIATFARFSFDRNCL